MRIDYCLGLVALAGFLCLPAIASAQFSSERIRSALASFFDDAPEMVAIAECESGLRQFTAGGTVLRGGWQDKMIGLFQLHEQYHRSAAASRGFNIDTLFGNIAYAKHLFEREGLSPWQSSAHCWKPKVAQAEELGALPDTPEAVEGHHENVPSASAYAAPREEEDAPGVAGPLTRRLTYTMVHEEVRIVQRALNAAGYTIAQSGPGALGQETNIFGPLTFRALTRFQCAEGIVCPQDADTAGYGVVDARTRAALNQIATQG